MRTTWQKAMELVFYVERHAWFFCRLRRRGFSSAGDGRRVLRASGFSGMLADTAFVLFITLSSVFRRHVFFLIRIVESDRAVILVTLLCAFRMVLVVWERSIFQICVLGHYRNGTCHRHPFLSWRSLLGRLR